MFGNESSNLLIIGDSDHESGKEADKGKNLSEKPPKKAPQPEQGEHSEKNQIHPVHCRKLLTEPARRTARGKRCISESIRNCSVVATALEVRLQKFFVKTSGRRNLCNQPVTILREDSWSIR